MPIRRTTGASLRDDPVVVGVAGAVALVGLVALLARPVIPQPVADVSLWMPIDVPDLAWDRFYFAQAAVAVLRPALLLILVATPMGRRLLGRLTGWMSDSVVGAALAAVDVLVVVDVITLPISWWGRLGEDDAVAWLAEWFIVRAQTWALIGLFAAGLTFAITRWPRSWHWRSAGAAVLLAVVIPLAADLDPFGGHEGPLPDGVVRESVEAAASRAGAGDIPIRVGSGVAAAELGAYVTGIGPSRSIVLSSVLVEGFTPEQITFVAMHEFAHREHLDVYRKVLGTAAGVVIAFWILRAVLRTGGVRRQVEAARAPAARRIVISLTVVAVVHALAMPVANLASRRSEMDAEWRALELTADPAAAIAMQRFILRNGGGDPSPPPWYQGWLATHPSPAERIGLAVRYAELHGVPLPPP